MDWRKAPSLIRELRIGYMIPELRSLVAKNVAMCLVRWAYGAFCVAIIAPIAIIGLFGAVMTSAGEWLLKVVDPIWGPSRCLRRHEVANLEASHAIMPVEEIRRIAYGEIVSAICQKEDKA